MAPERSPRRQPHRSLKARALQLLAQREHSRVELRRKLLDHARADPATDTAAGAHARVEAALDWLETHHHLSDARFVESRVHARAARHGNLRIQHELAQHALAPSAELAEALKTSEFERARAVWARKFGLAPASAAERGRQMRFLAGRGFSAEVIRRLLRAADRGGDEGETGTDAAAD